MIKPPSNQGSGSGVADVKYQKAIKQISKLISINTNLKKDISTLQQSYDKLKSQHQILQQKLRNLQLQLQQLKSNPRISTLSTERQLQDETLSKDTLCTHCKQYSTYDFPSIKQKTQSLEQNLQQKSQKLEQIKKDYEDKLNQNRQLFRKYLDITDELSKTKNSQIFKKYQASEKQKKKLKIQLEHSEEWVRKISIDFDKLKKQLIFSSNSSMSVKSIQMGSMCQVTDPLSDFYFQKLKKSEAQILKVKKQHTQRKQKYKSQLYKLQQQSQQKSKKLTSLSIFIQKQKAFIQKFVFIQKSF